MNVQNVLDQLKLKLIQIRYIQIRYIQFRIKITTRTFFSGRDNDRAPARQATRTFFSGRNNDRAPARQMTGTFFLRLELFFFVVITICIVH